MAQLTLAADLGLDYVGLGARNTEQNIKFYVKNNFNIVKGVNNFIRDAEANNVGIKMLHNMSTIKFKPEKVFYVENWLNNEK